MTPEEAKAIGLKLACDSSCAYEDEHKLADQIAAALLEAWRAGATSGRATPFTLDDEKS